MNNYCWSAQNGTPRFVVLFLHTYICSKKLDSGVIRLAQCSKRQRVARDCRAYINEAFVIDRISFSFSSSIVSATPPSRIFLKEHRQPTYTCSMSSHHILSALYAIIFSSAVSLYSGVLASPLPLPLAFLTPEYGRLSYTRNSSAIWQGDANPAIVPHHVDNFLIDKGHSLHQREEDYLYTLLGFYQVANTNGLKFCESGYLTFP
jgi:hypothetical protein